MGAPLMDFAGAPYFGYLQWLAAHENDAVGGDEDYDNLWEGQRY